MFCQKESIMLNKTGGTLTCSAYLQQFKSGLDKSRIFGGNANTNKKEREKLK